MWFLLLEVLRAECTRKELFGLLPEMQCLVTYKMRWCEKGRKHFLVDASDQTGSY